MKKKSPNPKRKQKKPLSKLLKKLGYKIIAKPKIPSFSKKDDQKDYEFHLANINFTV